MRQLQKRCRAFGKSTSCLPCTEGNSLHHSSSETPIVYYIQVAEVRSQGFRTKGTTKPVKTSAYSSWCLCACFTCNVIKIRVPWHNFFFLCTHTHNYLCIHREGEGGLWLHAMMRCIKFVSVAKFRKILSRSLL